MYVHGKFAQICGMQICGMPTHYVRSCACLMLRGKCFSQAAAAAAAASGGAAASAAAAGGAPQSFFTSFIR